MSWNGYPTFTHNSFIKRLNNSPREVLKKDDTKKTGIKLPYLSNIGNNMKNNYF